MTNNEAVINFCRNRKQNLINVMGGKCCICGFDKYNSALEFHHVNSEDKDFGITQGTTTKAVEKQLDELRKCILVCANCHRGIHYNNLPIPENWQTFFNEEAAQELIKRTHAARYYCADCGAPITRHGSLCVECARKASRKVARPDREELKHLIRTLPFTQIGAMYNVNDNSVRKWCDAVNLPRKKSDIEKYSDEEWELI